MITALDAPDEMLDDGERKVVAMVREHGWFDHRVMGGGEWCDFNYTTGFFAAFGMPEVLLFSLKRETAHKIFWNVYEDLKTGLRFRTGISYDNFTHSPVVFQPVDKSRYAEYIGWNRWFYGNDQFECWQMIWPDKQGLFPWHAAFDETLKPLQPDLSEGRWNGFEL